LDRVVGIATGCGLDGLGFEFWEGEEDFPFSKTALGPTRPHIQWASGVFPMVKVNNEWIYNSSPPIRHYEVDRDNTVFYSSFIFKCVISRSQLVKDK
jgi:hypothetical protein